MTDEKEFMNELDAAVRMKPSAASHFMFLTIASLITAFILWSNYAEIEEITHGQGKVVPSQEIQVVQSLEGGILAELLIKEGGNVKKDQILAKISDIEFSSEERGTEARTFALKAKRMRLEAEASNADLVISDEIESQYPDIARNEKALYQSRKQELINAKSILDDKISSARAELSETQATINRLYESRKLLNEELDITKKMVAKRAMPKIEEIRLSRELANISGQIREASERKRGLEADVSQAEKERADKEDRFKSRVLEELNDVESQISQLDESLVAIEDRVLRTDIRSPVDGVVNKIALKTIGGIVEPAMKLVEIVPMDDNLKIIAQVTPQEIAFLRPGQPVNIKLSAYDPQRYGSLKGELVRIGANSVSDRDGNVFFEIEVVAHKNYLGTEDNPLPITPGMVADIEIITGKRTIASYLMKPVLRAKDKALTER